MTDAPEQTHAIIESLRSLGLTKYEALVYTALLKVEGATATEIHEISGVPRASVYPVLDKLVQKNLVSVSQATPKRFNATPPEEGVHSLLSHIKKDALKAEEALTEIYRQREGTDRGCQELIWSIYGEENIRNRLTEMITRTDSDLKLLINWHFLSGELLELLRSREETLSIEIVTDRWEGKSLSRATVSGLLPEGQEKFNARDMAGIFIADGAKVMVLMGSADMTPTALYSESAGFIQFFTRYWSLLKRMIEQQQSPGRP